MMAQPNTINLALPRSEWERHPNYPGQVLLLGSHESFRHISARLIEGAAGSGSVAADELLYRRWISAMRSHEAYEERKLYPFLEARWNVSMSGATAGHEELHLADEQVRRAFANQDANDVLSALREHDRVLGEHLELEESLVIPLLLALSPNEFRDYYTLPVHILLERLRSTT